MPPKATMQDIKAYRERRLLIMVDMVLQAAHCSLVRFVRAGCGKTVTFYPAFGEIFRGGDTIGQ